MLCDFLLLFFLCPSKSHQRIVSSKKESECLIFVISDRHTECAPCLLVTRNGNGLFYYIKRRATVKLQIHGKLQCRKYARELRLCTPAKWPIVVVVSLRCAGVKIGVAAMGRIRCSRYFNYCLLHRNSLMKGKYHTRRKRAKKREVASAAELYLEKVLKGSAQLSVNEIACLKH